MTEQSFNIEHTLGYDMYRTIYSKYLIIYIQLGIVGRQAYKISVIYIYVTSVEIKAESQF